MKYAPYDTNTVQTARTCSPAAGSEDNRVEPAAVGGQEVRADVHHFRLQAAGHRYLVEERSAFAGDEGDGKYQPAPRHQQNNMDRWRGAIRVDYSLARRKSKSTLLNQ